eukprot:2580232-Amphidinium_carterae.1
MFNVWGTYSQMIPMSRSGMRAESVDSHADPPERTTRALSPQRCHASVGSHVSCSTKVSSAICIAVARSSRLQSAAASHLDRLPETRLIPEELYFVLVSVSFNSTK